MKRLFLIALILFGFGPAGFVRAQERTERRWIELRDRGTVLPPNASLVPSVAGVSERALQRRAKVLPPDKLIQENDLPISEAVLDALRATGVRIRCVSRWLNAVSVDATQTQLASILQLPIVRHSTPVAHFRRAPIEITEAPENAPPQSLYRRSLVSGFDYGASLTQLTSINAVELHDLGVVGKGVIVGMLDDGYTNHLTHEALAPIEVIGEYDFIQRDTNTSRMEGEPSGQGNHGAGTLSVLGGYKPGKLIGVAPRARFMLGKTEIIGSETHIEEDLYVEGLEWLERSGADIVSTSLGYRDFDAGTYSYPFDSLDGKSTIVARAASIAASKGVLLVTAAGNEGFLVLDTLSGKLIHVDRTLVSPSDADSILGVGATASDGELATFSGTGPTADGRIKPDIVAQGLGVYWAGTGSTSSYGYANGTSLATPLTAGAAALVLSAHPQLTPMQVREAIIQTGRHINDGTWQTASYPNNYYGHGLVDALQAALYHGPVSSNHPEATPTATGLDFQIMVRSNAVVPADSVKFVFKVEGATTFTTMKLQNGTQQYQYSGHVDVPTGGKVLGYFTFADVNGRTQRLPYNAPDSLLDLASFLNSVNPFVPNSFLLYQNYPNPFNAGTIIEANIPVNGQVDVDIFDMLGRHIRKLYSGATTPALLRLVWDGRNSNGTIVSTGVYIYRLNASGVKLSRTMLFVR